MKQFGKESQQIHVGVGEIFSVELEGSPTSGYVWSLHNEPQMVRVVEQTTQPSGGIGGSARQRFVLEPVKPGNTTLIFKYGRPWEDKALEKTEIRVQIDG